MTVQTIEQLFLFQKKVIQKKQHISDIDIQWIEHYITVDRDYFTKDDLKSFINNYHSIDYVAVDKKLYKGNLFDLEGYKNKQHKIIYNDNEYDLSNVHFDADAGCNVYQVIVEEETLEPINLLEIEDLIDGILEKFKTELEENKKYQEALIMEKGQKKVSFVRSITDKIIKTKRLF